MHGVGAPEGQWSTAHPQGNGGGITAKGLPSQAAGTVGKKGPVADVKGWTDPGSAHPSPKQGCSEPHAGQGTEAGAGSQPQHRSWQIPTPPPGLCPRRCTKLQRSCGETMPICVAPPVQLQVPPAAPARSAPKVESQQWPSSSRSASPRWPSPARGSHSYHHEKKGFRLWKLCVYDSLAERWWERAVSTITGGI